MNDDSTTDGPHEGQFFVDFPEAVVGRGVQVLLLDKTWRWGQVVSVTPDPEDELSLGDLVLSSGANIPGKVVAAIVCAN